MLLFSCIIFGCANAWVYETEFFVFDSDDRTLYMKDKELISPRTKKWLTGIAASLFIAGGGLLACWIISVLQNPPSSGLNIRIFDPKLFAEKGDQH